MEEKREREDLTSVPAFKKQRVIPKLVMCQLSSLSTEFELVPANHFMSINCLEAFKVSVLRK